MNIAISKDGTRIAYEKTGKGPAVVLVTGAFSYRRFPDQVELARLLSDRYTVYYYDRRGRGDSGDAAVYAPQREVEDLEAVLAAAGEPACVWALSSGAMIALRAAAGGADIAKLALHEPPFIVGGTGPAAAGGLRGADAEDCRRWRPGGGGALFHDRGAGRSGVRREDDADDARRMEKAARGRAHAALRRGAHVRLDGRKAAPSG